MFNKVLVALDGSDHAAKALDMAVKLVQRCDAELVLFHAVQLVPFRSDYDLRVVESARDVFRKIGREQAESIMQEAERAARDGGATKTVQVIGEGDPVKAMLKTVRDTGVDLVIVGTRGLTGLREIAMGSVAHKMSVAAPCPVLIVK